MKPAVINGRCRFIGHCATCRTDPAWRAQTGTPEICPHGFTLENLPVPEAKVFRVKIKKKGCGPCKPVTVTFTARP